MHGLRDLRVIDFSTGIAGPSCTKLFADAGADVIKVEDASGDELRRWSASGADVGDGDGALFRFLHHSKRAIVGHPEAADVLALIAGADLVVESFSPGRIEALDLPRRFPALVVLSISPFGRGGPYTHRPATEFTIQAECGSIAFRGLPGKEPFQAGGRITEWAAGAYAAVAALAAVGRSRRSGHGEAIDLSLLETMTIVATMYADLMYRLIGTGEPVGPAQTVETPSIEPTADGYVGFCTNSAQQFADFLLLIERPELQQDPVLGQVFGRRERFDEWNAIVRAWTTRHTTAEVVERAAQLRIPVAPVLNGETVLRHPHLVARGVFIDDPTGAFKQPRRPFRIDAEPCPALRPAPRLGEHGGRIEPRERRVATATGPAPMPLAGIRILDMTSWWAGPSATHVLAALGADVIHIESTRRPDGVRMTGAMAAARFAAWWECSSFFLAANANKRSLTLDLSDRRAVDLFKRLVAVSDAVVENFSPRVLDNFGLGWEALHAVNPRTILVRMPAFGLDGPWRDHVGFAQTMEQVTGLAWVTGHVDDQPRLPRGPCDPLAGMNAAFAFLVALGERDATGRGSLVEVPMVEGALNAAAEQVVEFTAYGRVLERSGNRSPGAAPQGLYACRGSTPGNERWLALSVVTDAQWGALKIVLGSPAWADEPRLATLAGRRAAHDAIDAQLEPWFAERERDDLVDRLLAAGVPAAATLDPRTASRHPQMAARGFHEELTHPVAGTQPVAGLPFRFASARRWLRVPAPTMGQDNHEILRRLAGLDDDEIARLEADDIIGDRPRGL
ncbi:MAG TPA: CoA transferase [Candidatus Bathyarchaeia archaeon]|nr:CoA transferase [Candidatus Bathyarchaeia archaeon]